MEEKGKGAGKGPRRHVQEERGEIQHDKVRGVSHAPHTSKSTFI